VIGAVLFDVDGTLIDSNDLHATAWRETFLHFGIDVPLEEIRQQIGKGGDNLIPALLPPDAAEQRQEEMEDFRSELFKRDYLPRVVPFPGVRALFERIVADGKKIVLASSAKGEEVEYHMGVIGARDLITATTSADDVEHSKPCPDIFAAALQKVSPLTAEQVLVVGDTPYDVSAAKKLGIRVIGVRSGGFPEESLTEAGADEIYDDPEHMLRSYEGSLFSRG
jgi:HAD superfamily hydrolase (TIGR01509 family)